MTASYSFLLVFSFVCFSKLSLPFPPMYWRTPQGGSDYRPGIRNFNKSTYDGCLLSSILHFGSKLHTLLFYFAGPKDQNETKLPQKYQSWANLKALVNSLPRNIHNMPFPLD